MLYKDLVMKPAGPPISPSGMAALRARYDHLLGKERPEIVEIVSWAAGNGDRSENGDYLYGRKRMREIDRELGYLARRMKALRVVNPADQTERGKVFFGATVTIADEDDNHKTLTIVGDDEQDAAKGRIGWSAPTPAPCARRRGRPEDGAPAFRREGMGSHGNRIPASLIVPAA